LFRVVDHKRCIEPQHPVAELGERSIAASIGRTEARVIGRARDDCSQPSLSGALTLWVNLYVV
jgi:hypothetical protein